MKKWNGVTALVLTAVFAVVFVNGTDYASADEGDDPTPNVEAQGKWVQVRNKFNIKHSPHINRVFRTTSLWGQLKRKEVRIFRPKGLNKPIQIYAEALAYSAPICLEGSSDQTGGNISSIEERVWKWKPAGTTINNKDITVTISGSANAPVSATITDNGATDNASATASFNASAKGNVGGDNIASLKIANKKITISAYVTNTTHHTSIGVSGKVSGGARSKCCRLV